MTQEKKPNSFDVFSHMVETDNKAIRLSALSNITDVRKVKAGTKVTIGVQGDVVNEIAFGRVVGGLILCDKTEFDKIKLELEAGGPVVEQPNTQTLKAPREGDSPT